MSTLNLNDYTPDPRNLPAPTGSQLADSQKVKTIGIIALILAFVGIVIPFVADIAAFLLAKWAMNISRRSLVPIEYEKPAYWAYRISLVGILLWVIVVVKIVL